MLKKILLGLVALFFIFIGSMWLLFNYVKNNPDSIYHAITKGIESYTEGQAYEEKSEENLHNVSVVKIESAGASIQIVPSDKETIEIVYSGKVPKVDSGPFIKKDLQDKILEIQLHEPLASKFFTMNINGQQTTKATDSVLSASIQMPKSFKGQLKIETKTGNVDISVPAENLYEFDLQSNQGNIENESRQGASDSTKTSEVGKIQVLTESGNISVTSPVELKSLEEDPEE